MMSASTSATAASANASDSGAEPAAVATAPPADPSASAADAAPQQSQTASGVQPLPEQFSKRQNKRQSPRFACHMDRLARVELQLVLQFLDRNGKLFAACCSRRLLQAADHPFAWAAAAPFKINTFFHPQPGTLVSRSLVRHAPLVLKLFSDLPAAQVALLPRLREMTASIPFSPDLMTLPALQALQKLRLHCSLSGRVLQSLTTLPQLHTLQIDFAPFDWSWLPSLAALTDLSLSNLPSSFSPVHEAIGQFARLHSLRLDPPLFEFDVFPRFCATPAMRRLRHLTLDFPYPSWHQPSAEEWLNGFIQLAQLESLQVTNVSTVDRLLTHLACVPTLRTLTLPCAADPLLASTHPSRAVLLQLLSASPRLHVLLHVAAEIDRWRESGEYRLGAGGKYGPVEKQMDEQWRQLQQLSELERVTVADEWIVTKL